MIRVINYKKLYDRGYYFEKNYMKALVVATTLAIPFATYSTPALAALKVEANQSVAAASDRTYDTEIKIYKDQKTSHLWFLNI